VGECEDVVLQNRITPVHLSDMVDLKKKCIRDVFVTGISTEKC
jgi:hypothetical protein